jgi:SAM-dependent methyltransferase
MAKSGPMIDPKQFIQDRTVEELCRTADEYFKQLSDPTSWMTKPFYSMVEAPLVLENLGRLLAGVELGNTMTVLDFGAGACWFSRVLCQLKCNAIACDVSAAALEIGKRLFAELPPLGAAAGKPSFLLFDGRHIDLADESVDRIVCLESFHHVSNPVDILREFGRVLKPGGIVGFSEPGKDHSASAQSQMEMRDFGVLENNIDLDEIFPAAQRFGFTRLSCRLLSNMNVSLAEYRLVVQGSEEGRFHDSIAGSRLERAVLANIRETMVSQTIFFLHKGEVVRDSRSHIALAHKLGASGSAFEIARGESVELLVTAHNAGLSKWLSANLYGVGVVRLGAHLYDGAGRLLNLDFYRQDLGRDVLPGETVQLKASIPFEEKGTYELAFDLVSEGVCWFENLGCQLKQVSVVVR